MQHAGATSWQMGTDKPQSLLMGLYIRDALGLRSEMDADIPPVEPEVPIGQKT